MAELYDHIEKNIVRGKRLLWVLAAYSSFRLQYCLSLRK